MIAAAFLLRYRTAKWAVASLVCFGCTQRDVIEAEGTSSGDSASSTSTSASDTGGTSTTGSTSTTTSGSTADPSTSTSAEESSTGIGDGCPNGVGVDALGAVTRVALIEWEKGGPFVGTCTAVEFIEDRLHLQCAQEGDPSGDVEVLLRSEGPIVPDLLAAMVGLEGLNLVAEPDYFPFQGSVYSLGLRSSGGDLLVLYVYGMRTPGDPAGLEAPGWMQPFESLELVDHGCEWVAGDDGSDPYRRFAVEVTADDGRPLPLFPGQQATVIAGGHPYEVSVSSATLYEDPCSKCATSAVSFSLVRHPDG